MTRPLALLATTLLATSCATATRFTPCPTGFQLDAHHTLGSFNGDDNVRRLTNERDGVDSNYRATELGGSVHFDFGLKGCKTLGQTEG